jgi:XTP/dITP diphosphohydrolase
LDSTLKTVVLATRNQHKVEEIRSVLADLPITFLSLADFPELPEVVEDGATCEENAVKKAKETATRTGQWALADDTGLEVTALGGRPGVYAARYAGEQASYADNCQKLLKELKHTPAGDQRGARFLTIMALADPEGHIEVVEGELQGHITEQFYGSQGFGYDPIFYVEKADKTLAQMTLTEKNSCSHRGQALQLAKQLLTRRLAITRSVGA